MSDVSDDEGALAEFDDFDPQALDEEEVSSDGEEEVEREKGDGDDLEEDDDEEMGLEDGEDEDIIYSRAGGRVDQFSRKALEFRVIEIVPSDERVTDNRLQDPEAARVLAVMAKHLSSNPRDFTDCSGLTDAMARARKHLYDGKCWLRVRRFVGYGATPNTHVYEEWSVNEMVLPPLN